MVRAKPEALAGFVPGIRHGAKRFGSRFSAVRHGILSLAHGNSFAISRFPVLANRPAVGILSAFLVAIMLKKLQTNEQDPKGQLAIAPTLRGVRRAQRKRTTSQARIMDGKPLAVPAIPPASVYFVVEFA